MKGTVLFWFTDTNRGELWLFDKNGKTICKWRKVERRDYDTVMSVLMTFLCDYVDFKNGGRISFVITSETGSEAPAVIAAYSTVPDRSGNMYTDKKAFCDYVGKTAARYIK